MTSKKSGRRVKRGGGGASSYMLKTVGTGNQQYNNVFKTGTPTQSNAIRSLNGKHMAGGSRRRRKSSKGGFWGHMINQALVPLTILGLQQTYRRGKTRGGTKRRR